MKHTFKISVIILSLGISFLTGCIKEDFDTPYAPTFIVYDSFKDSLGSFTQYSVTGAQVWAASSYSGTTYAQMSGYSGGSYIANEDWLISKAINFDLYKNESLSFNSATKYGNVGDGSLKVYTSTDYTGTGDPHLATWVEITPSTLSTGGFVWSTSVIDLTGLTGSNVHIAFKYLCGTSAVPTWELTKIKITGDLN